VASALGEALGKPVKYVPVPVAAMVESVTKMGLDDYNQVRLARLLHGVLARLESQVTSAVKDLTGIDAPASPSSRATTRPRSASAEHTRPARHHPRVGGPEARARRAGARRVQPLS